MIWATSSLATARSWARAACAVHGGEPIVLTVETVGDVAAVATLAGDSARAIREELEEVGSDLVEIGAGEDGRPELAIVGSMAARFRV